jgi:hypothetical protein
MRLLENENRFSSCDVTLPKPSLSCRMSGTGETTQCREATKGLTAHPAESEFCSGN